MAISSFEISLIVILIIVIGIFGWLIFINWQWYQTSKNGARYRSFNVPQGKTFDLKCPVGFGINVDTAYVGSSPGPGANAGDANQCYTELTGTMSNPNLDCKMPTEVYSNKKKNKKNLSDTITTKCAGKTSCTLTTKDIDSVVNSSGRSCSADKQNGGSCTPYVFGVYNCTPL